MERIRKFKIGDIVVVTRPNADAPKTKGLVCKITNFSDGVYPYTARILSNVSDEIKESYSWISKENHTCFNENEITLIDEKEALAWLI